MRLRRVAWIAGAGLAAWAAWMAARPHAASPPPSAQPLSSAASAWLHAGASLDAAPPAMAFDSGLENLPASLRGTQVPGQLETDGAGRLKVNHSLRDLFDYFLSASGEEPGANSRARVAAYVRSRLPRLAWQRLMAIFDDYVRYKDRAAQLAPPASGPTLEQLRARLAAVRALRTQCFSADVAQAFFEGDDAYDDYEIAQAAILQDRSLGASDKAKALAQLRSTLSPELRDGISVAETVKTLDEVTADWKKRSGTPSELRSIRENLVGAAAADRLEALDHQNLQWDSRVASYLDQRGKILQDPSLSDTLRQQQIQTLREQSFDLSELVRIDALERIHDAAASPHT